MFRAVIPVGLEISDHKQTDLHAGEGVSYTTRSNLLWRSDYEPLIVTDSSVSCLSLFSDSKNAVCPILGSILHFESVSGFAQVLWGGLYYKVQVSTVTIV